MENELLKTAGYCGLACKACSVYIASCIGGETLEKRAKKSGMTSEEIYCKGCRSDKTSPFCTDCQIKSCIGEKNLMWCSECPEYPCSRLVDFQNSLPHRSEILGSLNFASKHSVEEWDEKMQDDFMCEKCGSYNSVYADGCQVCKNEIANSFVKRHWNIIKDSPERKLV